MDSERGRGRNTFVLAGAMALTWAVVQPAVGFAGITLSELMGSSTWAGVAPALFIGGWAVAAPSAGRFMDARGRRAGLTVAFASGAVLSGLLWLGTTSRNLGLYLVGITLVGAACGWANLAARAGAADMYPPARRARGVGFVMAGAAVGAVLAPLLFAPLLRDLTRDASTLAAPWLGAAAIMLAGVALTRVIRRDPRDFRPDGAAPAADAAPRPIGVLVRLPGVPVALLAATVSQAVMASMMTVIGVAMRDHGHHASGISQTISVHFLGMFGLVAVVGILVDRAGRQRSMIAGLAVVAASTAALAAGLEMATMLPAMFALGLGWNIAFVAATAAMGDATAAHERGRLLGFGDLLAVGVAAPGTIAAGVLLNVSGLATLAFVGAGIAALAVLGVLPRRRAAIAPATIR